jgi:hypothetical protein
MCKMCNCCSHNVVQTIAVGRFGRGGLESWGVWGGVGEAASSGMEMEDVQEVSSCCHQAQPCCAYSVMYSCPCPHVSWWLCKPRPCWQRGICLQLLFHFPPLLQTLLHV